MRSLLQFLGFASSTVCATLLAGILLTTSANADATIPDTPPSCTNCCQCNTDYSDCVKSSAGSCWNDSKCTSSCKCQQSNQGVYLCYNG